MRVLAGAQQAVPIMMWTDGVPVELEAENQLRNIASMPFIHKHVAVMPDVHVGIGATVGSVIPTVGAIIPAAVGVDLGCGMRAVRLALKAKDLPDNLHAIRSAIEAAVPHGRTNDGAIGSDKGGWGPLPTPPYVIEAWEHLKEGYREIVAKHPKLDRGAHVSQLGTLGTGNHFIELCLDKSDNVWIMLHSGSRGVGNRIGSYFIEKAKEDMRRWFINLPDTNLAYIPEQAEHFHDYVTAVGWAQKYAEDNRSLMLSAVRLAVVKELKLNCLTFVDHVVDCHHNYIAKEHHYGQNVWVTRKGAVRARKGDMGIIPGSMGAKSYIVRGLGNEESFCSSSHGAGRRMSRTAAKKAFSLADHARATAGVECKKDESVLDETPGAYKDIDAVMEAQKDLVEVVHTLRQVLCVKG